MHFNARALHLPRCREASIPAPPVVCLSLPASILLRLAGAGKTLLVTSHILPELARICHRVAIITRGRLRAFGTLEEIARQLSQLRTMEALLARAEAVPAAAEIIRRHVEPDAQINPSPAELAVIETVSATLVPANGPNVESASSDRSLPPGADAAPEPRLSLTHPHQPHTP